VASTPPVVSKTLPTSLADAVNSGFRDPNDRKRDQYRHPLETLEFFGIAPTMTVVEISPSAGWYTQILAPYLASQGHYIAATNGENNGEATAGNAKLAAWMKENGEVASHVTFTEFDPPSKVEIAPPESADLVVTFRNVHNWMSKHAEKAAFASFFKALKPGGILGVVEHRADPKSKKDKDGHNGYVAQDAVIAMAKKAGFKLIGKSEINANPKDTKDYAKGVWTLPPTLRLGDKDHEKYEAIGESDRMTLKFMKPRHKSKK
jgi:predicted methyltransferase